MEWNAYLRVKADRNERIGVGMTVMESNRVKKEVLGSLHYSSLENAGLSMLYLSALSKTSEYRRDEQRFEEKYSLTLDGFSKTIDSQNGEESFDKEDDLMAWRYAHEARLYWEKKALELDQCS